MAKGSLEAVLDRQAAIGETADFEKEVTATVSGAMNPNRYREVAASGEEGSAPKSTMTLAEAMKIQPGDPKYGDARLFVGTNAMARNHPSRTAPERPKKTYLVDGNRIPVHANSKLHALALQNDADKNWPGPFGRNVVEVESISAEYVGVTDEEIQRKMQGAGLAG